jgi:hypothetical protein
MPAYNLLSTILMGALATTALAYPEEHLPEGNTTNLAIAHTKFGQHVIALGKDSQLWQLYTLPNGSWSTWQQLSLYCPSKNESTRMCEFDSDPAVGVNTDGRLEVFARFKENLDLWKFDQKNASDPTSWSTPRETSCVDQDQNTAIWYCIGEQNNMYGNPTDHYWVGQPIFPTSNPTIINDPVDGRLVVYFRGFEGLLYESHQLKIGSGVSYSSPVPVAVNRIIE